MVPWFLIVISVLFLRGLFVVAKHAELEVLERGFVIPLILESHLTLFDRFWLFLLCNCRQKQSIIYVWQPSFIYFLDMRTPNYFDERKAYALLTYECLRSLTETALYILNVSLVARLPFPNRRLRR